MKEFKYYLLRSMKDKEAIAVAVIPARFNLRSLQGGEVKNVSVGMHFHNDPSIIYEFHGTGKNNVNDVRTLELEVCLKKEYHEMLQNVVLEEITESYFETAIELGLIWLQNKGFSYGSVMSKKHQFKMIEVAPPISESKSDAPHVSGWVLRIRNFIDRL